MCSLIETNHDADMLRHGPYPWSLKQRIASRHGHLANHQTEEVVSRVGVSDLRCVVGLHLSAENNAASLAQGALRRAVPDSIPVDVVTRSEMLRIELDGNGLEMEKRPVPRNRADPKKSIPAQIRLVLAGAGGLLNREDAKNAKRSHQTFKENDLRALRGSILLMIVLNTTTDQPDSNAQAWRAIRRRSPTPLLLRGASRPPGRPGSRAGGNLLGSGTFPAAKEVGVLRVGFIPVDRRQGLLELVEAANSHQPVPQSGGVAESPRIPAAVLAEAEHGLVFTEPVLEHTGVLDHEIGNLAEIGLGGDRLSLESSDEVAEKPWSAEATAADRDAGTAGFIDHADGVFGDPDVAVAENRDRELRL